MKTSIKYQVFPFLQWGKRVNKKTLKSDFIAGLTGAVIVLPQGVAFAMIAGMPPIYGLYTAMVTPIIAALFGSSYHLISGPTTAISIVVFSSISPHAAPTTEDFVQLTLILTFIAGIIQFALGLSRMGTLVNFVSHSVVIGFTAGAALLIATSQVKHIFGLEVARGLSFQETWMTILHELGNTNLYILLIALATLLIAILIKKIAPRLPNLLLAMIMGSLLSILIEGESRGVTLVGKLPSYLPPFSIPNITFESIQMLAPNAFAIALLGLIEAVAIARSIAAKTGQRIDGNQEFIGQGLSNIIGSMFSSYAGSGSFTRSGVNYQAGAKTPLAAIFAALILMASLLFIAPLTAWLPIPAMGGIILLVAYNLIDFHHIRQVFVASKREAIVLSITFLSTLLFDLEFAIYFGVLFSLIFYLQRTSKPTIVAMAPDPSHSRRKFAAVRKENITECPQLKILSIEGSVFFGAVNHVGDRLAEEKLIYKHILIVCSGINLLDVAGAELLVSEAKNLSGRRGQLYLSSMNNKMKTLLKKGGYWDQIGDENIFDYKEIAISNIFPRLRKNICDSCEVRIFKECNEA